MVVVVIITVVCRLDWLIGSPLRVAFSLPSDTIVCVVTVTIGQQSTHRLSTLQSGWSHSSIRWSSDCWGARLTLTETTKTTQLCSHDSYPPADQPRHVLPMAVEGAPERENPMRWPFSSLCCCHICEHLIGQSHSLGKPKTGEDTTRLQGQGHGKGGMKNRTP